MAAVEMRWWGWGDPAHAEPPPAQAVAWLAEELGGLDAPRGPVALGDVRLGEPTLPAAVRERFGAILRDDREARILHARGKGYPDLVRQRAGDARNAPDAVLLPRRAEEVAAVLAACAGHGVAVVPFGGGTSVVGGVEPLRGGFGAVVALDLAALDGLEELDERARTATVAAGARLRALEERLRARGYTLGHFPQSFEYVSVGGCVATRSAGQASTGYGGMADLVLGVRMAAPAGALDLAPVPASAAGPDLRELVVGSEGVLGVITRVSLRVRARPAETRYEGWMLASFAAGTEALRALAQEGAAPDVARLSDEPETRMSFGLAGDGGVKGAAVRRYVRARGVADGCLAITGWEGDAQAVRERRAASAAILARHGAVGLGRSPGHAWARGRFHGPYLRDDLLDLGVLVETLETAAPWSALPSLHRAVGDALRGQAPLVTCHVSHLYETGASLYFTFLARQDRDDPLGQWRRAKTAACEAIVAHGGTITHHHAVGVDHVPWIERELGSTGVAALRALKAELDPAGIMNPGKLLPPG